MNRTAGDSRRDEAIPDRLEVPGLSPDAHRPFDLLDGDLDSNGHYALLYESPEEQFEAVVPFVRDGLDAGEQVFYIVGEHSRETVLSALRDGGVDVDAALESGQLSLHAVTDTYLDGGEFDVDEARSLLEAAMDEATEEYDGFRATAEETWLLEQGSTTQSEFAECESHVNDLLEGEDCLALCQYDRSRLPAAVVDDVLDTHPRLIYDGAVCENLYYTPPEEYFDPDPPTSEVDRKLETLADRNRARSTLQTQERYQREVYEAVSSTGRTFEEKLQSLFELGCERFGLEFGGLARVDPDRDRFEVEAISDEHDYLVPGASLDLSETYCRVTADREVTSDGSVPEPIGITDPAGVGFEDEQCIAEFGLYAYLGTRIPIEGDVDRTFFFVASEPREEPVTEEERSFLRLMAQWVKYELERRQRERCLRESYEITSDPALSFDEKLDRLLELGREWFDLDMAGLNHLQSSDEFEVETAVGFDADEAFSDAVDDPYFCRSAIADDAPVGRHDVRGTEWEEDWIHREFGLTSYLGTKVVSGSTTYGTLWFGSRDPRDRPFSDTERTFLDLMGQWTGYEMEREARTRSQRRLYEITANPQLATDEKIERILAVGCEHLGLPVGMLNRDRGEDFEIETLHGTHPDVAEGACTPAASEHYCREVVESLAPLSVADAAAEGWDDDPLFTDVGLETYAGVPVVYDGEIYGTLCFTDTTPRESAFTDAEQTFLDLVGQCVGYELEREQKERDLEATIDQLQQSNDRLKQFAYAASHDLQEPLRMVSSYLQLLEKQHGDELEAEAEEYIEFAVDGADRMRSMVDDLLAFSRVEQSDAALQPVDCDAVLDRVLADHRMQIEERGAEVAVDSLPSVRGASDQLEQLFGNLLSNAIKYNDSDPPRVEITAEECGDDWEFAVADNGIGIDPDSTERIFEVFKRLHHDDEYPGTGVGLSLCQKIVSNHGGDIRVESESGEGSTFYVTLPRHAD